MHPSDAARILLRRRRMRESLVGFAQSISIPGAPVGGDDSELFAPVGSGMAAHHVLLCEEIQKCLETDYGRLMLFLPPGAAKSTYASAIAPAWAMGRWPGFQVILASYNTTLAAKHGRKARAICKQGVYRDAFGASISKATSAAEMWAIERENGLGSEYMAGGLLSGLTGNRADALLIDDPIRGRQDADSPTIRSTVWSAIEEDAMTRLKPRGSIILVQTRWHPLDPAGMLLGEDYDGRTGPWVCTDGMTWQVVNIPAECEREDDPLGRKIGDMLWPEYFDEQHWKPHRSKPRSWASLYQQRPTVEGGGRFKEEWVQWYEPGEEPKTLNYYGADDYGAPNDEGTSDDPDFTEMGIAGMDTEGRLWLVDWWYEQGASTDTGIVRFCNLVKKWKPRRWFGEKGVIHNAIAGARKRKQKQMSARCTVELLPSNGSKVAKAEAFFSLCESGQVMFPNVPWAHRLVKMLCAFPVVAHDDGVDVCANLGRALEKQAYAYEAEEKVEEEIRFGSVKWLMLGSETRHNTKGRTR